METIKAKIERISKEETKLFVGNLKTNIKQKLDGALLSLLGLEHRYNTEYEIDHCNGRNSVLIDAIRDMAEDEVKKIVKNIAMPLENPQLFKQAFKKELKSQIDYQVREIARVKAKELAQQYVDEVTPKEIKEIMNKEEIN